MNVWPGAHTLHVCSMEDLGPVDILSSDEEDSGSEIKMIAEALMEIRRFPG